MIGGGTKKFPKSKSPIRRDCFRNMQLKYLPVIQSPEHNEIERFSFISFKSPNPSIMVPPSLVLQ